MPSKNSVNKPKDNMIRQRKSHMASKRRQRRSNTGVTIIKTSKGTNEIVPLLTNNRNKGGVIANTIISNKKAKKIERNIKYAEMRRNGNVNGKKLKVNGVVDIDMKEDGNNDNNTSGPKESAVRKALWSIVDGAKISGLTLAVASGEGTTLGGPSF
ncbi:ribosome biogenesis protein alb1 [Pichia californica]|uniref:Ribosome biogenesis protein alb1 n=1 Tax=Pichia californica TaxID=460514 RepID=A0A9P7BH17_9ASCO|nr:ribosome biogenesis protein alb1 [[Candida] californica]KAG0689930.1 ribosome biogenesis protein alb1 [[Candida] californica]